MDMEYLATVSNPILTTTQFRLPGVQHSIANPLPPSPHRHQLPTGESVLRGYGLLTPVNQKFA